MSSSNKPTDAQLAAKYKQKAAEKSTDKGVPHFWKLDSTVFGGGDTKSKKLSILTIAGAPQLYKKNTTPMDFVYYKPEMVAGTVSQIQAFLARIGKSANRDQILAQSFTSSSPGLSGFRAKREGSRTAVNAEDMSAKLSQLYDTVMAIKMSAADIKSVSGKPRAKSPKAKKSEKKTPKAKKSEKKTPKAKKTPSSKTPKTPKAEGLWGRFSESISGKGFHVTDNTMKKPNKEIAFNDPSKPVPYVNVDGKNVYVRLTTANAASLNRFISEVLDQNSSKSVNLAQPTGPTVSVNAGSLAAALRAYTYPPPAPKTSGRGKKTSPPSAGALTSSSAAAAAPASTVSPRMVARVQTPPKAASPRASVAGAAEPIPTGRTAGRAGRRPAPTTSTMAGSPGRR